MKNLPKLILLLVGFLQFNTIAQTIFTKQFNGTGNMPSISTPYSFNITTAYPSPLLTSEMAAPTPSLRGLDAGYSVIVGGNYNIPFGGGSESEGRVAVGGNLINNKGALYGIAQSGGGTFVVGKGDDAFLDGYSIYALAVAGDLAINANSSLSLGANNISHPYTVGVVENNGELTATNTVIGENYIPVDIKSMLDEMTTLSLNMSKAVPSSTINIGTTNFLPTYLPAVFIGSGNKDIEVFNIDASDLSLATFVNPIEFDGIKEGATIIINVSGTTISRNNYVAQVGRVNDPNIGASDKNALVYNLVWNFYEATNISTSAFADINGMIIAPYADLIVNSNINGRVYIGGDLIHSGPGTEIHNFPFLGDLSLFYSVLPVELVFINASIDQCKAILEWATASELNNNYFEVQRSSDSFNWEAIGTVDGNGNSNQWIDYQFVDENILSGINYYRLKQVDYDGTVDYYKIISVDANVCSNTTVKVFPLPAQNILNVYLSYKNFEEAQLSIIDASGKRIRTISNVDATNQINLSNIPNGSYFLQINLNNNHVRTYKFSIIK